MNKVEMQIISYKSPERNPKWFQECLTSIENEPVDLKIFQGKKNHNYNQRHQFINQCKTPYLCWVDDDDRIIPGTVQKCLDFLELPENKSFCGVYTNHYVLNEQDQTQKYFVKKEYSREEHSKNIHRPFHFLLARTEAALNFTLNNYCQADLFFFLAYCSLFGDWKHLNIPGYIWRNHPFSHGKKIPNFKFILKECEEIILSKT